MNLCLVSENPQIFYAYEKNRHEIANNMTYELDKLN